MRNPVASKSQGRYKGHIIQQKKGRGSYKRNVSMDETEPRPRYLLTYFCDNCEILWQDRYDSEPDGRCHICRTYWRPFTQDSEVSWQAAFEMWSAGNG